jgi:cobalt-zinc-cadmium efflux system outer membrane protein
MFWRIRNRRALLTWMAVLCALIASGCAGLKTGPQRDVLAPIAGDSSEDPVDAPAKQDEDPSDRQAQPAADEPEELPATKDASKESASEEIPPVAGAREVSLNQVINACLLADPRLRAGFESINQANADALTASLRPNPLLFADIQLLPLTRPFTPTSQGGPPQQDLNLTYPIDWFLFGKQAAAMQSASLRVRVSQAEYADLVRVRVLQAALAYYDVVEAKAIRSLADQDVESLQRVEAITRTAVENGRRARVELSRIELDRLKAEQLRREAERDLVATMARLRAAVGMVDPTIRIDVSGKLDEEFSVPPAELDSDELFTQAQINRPDMEARKWRIAQADAETESQRRKGYPTVAPQFGYTRQYQNKSIGFPDADSWSAALTVSLPWYDRNQGNQSRAASVAVQARHEMQIGIVDLRAELAEAMQEYMTAKANAEAVANDQLRLAREVRDSINKAYDTGTRPLIDVLDAQRNYRETYRLFIGSRTGYGRSVMKLNAAVGQQVVSP